MYFWQLPTCFRHWVYIKHTHIHTQTDTQTQSGARIYHVLTKPLYHFRFLHSFWTLTVDLKRVLVFFLPRRWVLQDFFIVFPFSRTKHQGCPLDEGVSRIGIPVWVADFIHFKDEQLTVRVESKGWLKDQNNGIGFKTVARQSNRFEAEA